MSRRVALLAIGASVLMAACSSEEGASDADRPTAEQAPEVGDSVTDTPDKPSAEPAPVQLDVGEFVFDAVVAGPDDGPAVFLLHGFPQTSQSWTEVIPALAEAGYRVIAPDQRGYSPGARPDGPESYVVPELVGDVLGMADELGIDEFHVVGHDWGAMVAWNLAIDHPDRVLTATPISVPHPVAFARALAGDTATEADPGPSDQAERSSYFELFRSTEAEAIFLADDAAFLRSIYDDADLTDEELSAYVAHFTDEGAMTGALNWYRAQTISSTDPVTVPTMYVWSTDDTALGRDGAELTVQYVEGPYRFEILEGISHWVPDQAPDQLNSLLIDHLATNAA